MFESEDIVDTGKGWIMHDNFIDIVALHEIDPKFLQDITKAKTYKIITKGKS